MLGAMNGRRIGRRVLRCFPIRLRTWRLEPAEPEAAEAETTEPEAVKAEPADMEPAPTARAAAGVLRQRGGVAGLVGGDDYVAGEGEAAVGGLIDTDANAVDGRSVTFSSRSTTTAGAAEATGAAHAAEERICGRCKSFRLNKIHLRRFVRRGSVRIPDVGLAPRWTSLQLLSPFPACFSSPGSAETKSPPGRGHPVIPYGGIVDNSIQYSPAGG